MSKVETMKNGEPLRVLQVVASMGHGGIEHFLMNLYRAIDRDKIQFDFMYRVPYECVFDKEIESLGGRVYRCVNPDHHPLSSWRFYREFFSAHPEIKAIHEHRSGCEGFFGAMRAAKKAGIPVRIIHSHSSQKPWDSDLIKEATNAFNASRLDSFANYFIACSDVAARHLYGRCSKAMEKCVISPNAIDLDAFAFNNEARNAIRGRYDIQDDSLVIGHVGRFVPLKNQSMLIDILANLRSRGARAELLLIGDGPSRSDVEEKARARGLSPYVHFAGIQEDTSPYYSAMDVFCMPSLFEGLPVSCVEAQANGLPMVLSNGISNMADICGHTECIDIQEEPARWGEAVVSAFVSGRSKNYNVLSAAGYGVLELAKAIELLYTGQGALNES